MAVTHDPRDFNTLIDFTQEVNQIDRQYAIFDDTLFDMRPTTQTAILFDINSTQTTLLPASERGSKGSTYGKDDAVETRALPLGYFKHSDVITQEDILSVRMPGTADGLTTVDMAVAEKMAKMRRQSDATLEYMKLKAASAGQCVSPDGVVYASMFDEFGIVRDTVALDTATSTTDLPTKLREIKRLVRANLKNGGFFSGIDMYLAPDLYDAFVSHGSMKDAYKYFSATVNPQRDDITDMFVTNGFRIHSLDGSFKLPTGSTEALVADGTGFIVPRVEGLFRGYYGPSSKLSTTHRPEAVQPVYSWLYDDGRDQAKEMTIEMAPLVFPTEVACLIGITA
jgi:hypothetical protein